MRIAAGLHKCEDGLRRFRLAQQDSVHAAAKDLAELPGVEANVGRVGAVNGGLDDDDRRAVARAGRAALDQAAHLLGEPCHVERAVLHPDIDVVGLDPRILSAPIEEQGVAGVTTDVMDGLVLRQ
jgi:hypothetical protein